MLELPLKVATIILSCIFSIQFSDFRDCGLINIPIPPITPLTEFFHADGETNVYPFPVSSDSWPSLFKLLTLNIAICIVLLHISSFYLCLSSVADFSNPGARAPSSAALFFTGVKGDAVCICGLSESHGNFSMAVFYVINRRHPKR